MSKPSKKDLLEYFDDICLFLANHHWTKIDERAVAIRELIQKKFKVTPNFIMKHAKIFMGLAETNAPLKIYQDFVAGLIKEIEEKINLTGGLNGS